MSPTPDFRRPAATTHPAYAHDAYASTMKRAPSRPLVRLDHTLTELTGPQPGTAQLGEPLLDLSRATGGEALGERIVVAGRVLDEDGRPVPNTLIEIWQANAAGRYRHDGDQHDAPLDPAFEGVGRVVTGADGSYRFMTIKPGAYPWRNHHNAWRPNHIHYSLFGPGFATRLITQMYFPGDPLFAYDPIFNSIPDEKARARLVSSFALDLTMPEYALGYRFDMVLRGRDATPMEV